MVETIEMQLTSCISPNLKGELMTMKKKKSVPRWLQIASTIVANAAIVCAVVYIVFYILDRFNPMLHFLSDQILATQYLDVIIAGLALILGVLFLICTWKIFYGKKEKKAKRTPRSRHERHREE